MLNIKYNGNQYLTWLYSDQNNGWLGTQTFNPEDMIRLNGDFYTFKNGEIYLHNQEVDGVTPNYNIFYGESFESEASFNFSQNPEIRKNYKTIELDGTDAWAVALQTNLDSGYINIADFEKKEGIYYGYVRYDNGVIDTAWYCELKAFMSFCSRFSCIERILASSSARIWSICFCCISRSAPVCCITL